MKSLSSLPRRLWLSGLIGLSVVLTASTAGAATFTVDSLLDFTDDTPGDGKCESLRGMLGDFRLHCTLRGAIEEANALPGDDEIVFAIAGMIQPGPTLDQLPAITETLTIDGRAAPGFNNAGTDLASRPPVVVLSGELLDSATGLWVQIGGSLSLHALSIVNFSTGVWLDGDGSQTFQGNYIGLYPDGSVGPNSSRGVLINSPSVIGKRPNGSGAFNGSGNVFSGNVDTTNTSVYGISVSTLAPIAW